MLIDKLDHVVEAVVKTTEITENTLKWAESRRDALKALTQISSTIGTSKDLGKTTYVIVRLIL